MQIRLKDDLTVEIKYCIRALMIFENISGHSFEIRNLTESYILLYSFILANNSDFNLKFFDEFLPILDEDPTVLVEFQEWFKNESEKQQLMMAEKSSKKSKKKVK